MIQFGLPSIVAVILSLMIIPLIRKICFSTGKVVPPREDRWHTKPTATLGGIGIFLAFSLSVLISVLVTKIKLPFLVIDPITWKVLISCTLMFILGLRDDLHELTPPAKLLGQVLVVTVVILLGFKTEFFTPRVENQILAEVLNIILTYIWIIGITNAFNLIDNIDGLASGIAIISALFLGYFFWKNNSTVPLTLSIILAGSVLGFLFYNFPPASIFMGDGGSLFIGFLLSLLAIVREPQASNLFAVMGVPILLFMLPIFDTVLVMGTRLLRGENPLKGGKDHTSHRLIAFGFTERKAILLLYGIGIISGILAATLEAIRYWYSLVLVPIVVILLAIVSAYLSGIKVIAADENQRRKNKITQVMINLTYRRRILEVIFDFFLIGLAYYAAFLVRYGFEMNEARYNLFLSTLPIALIGIYIAFFVFGVYKAIWSFFGVKDLIKYLQASFLGVLLVAFVDLLFIQGKTYTVVFFMIFWSILSLGLILSRSSFQVMRSLARKQGMKQDERIIIIGTENEGELVSYWVQTNPELPFRIIGFINDDPLMVGRSIHGLPVLGGYDQIENTIKNNKVNGVILTETVENDVDAKKNILSICHQNGCWLRIFKINFEKINP